MIVKFRDIEVCFKLCLFIICNAYYINIALVDKRAVFKFFSIELIVLFLFILLTC